jgi:UPF0716 protein FxsA
MPIFILLFILLCFPALEIYTLFQLANVIGWWLAVWLTASALFGFLLIREEKLAFFGRLVVGMQSGQHPFAAMFDSGKTLMAGVLLIFPGVISDAIALILLLIPSRKPEIPVKSTQETDVIEGSYRREE